MHEGVVGMVDYEMGSLVHCLGMARMSCPPEGIWFLGVTEKVKVEAVLT